MNLKEIYDSHNHNGISKQVFYKRIREGMDPFEALQYVSNIQKNILKLFKEHENKYNLSYRTVQRLESGKSFEEAMSYPSGINKFQKFKNGWIVFEGEWTNVDNLEMIFDKETTENMIKSGVKVEKLFTKRKG